MAQSGHVDTFTQDNLPPREQWPAFKFRLHELRYPERLNCVTHWVDRWVEAGQGDRPCLLSPAESLTYAELNERVNRIANVLTRELGMVPGNRVLLRAANNPMMVASYFAVIKAGGVVVATMPLLRAKELSYPLSKAKIALALCDMRLGDEMEKAKAQSDELKRVVYWGSGASDALETLMSKPGYEKFTACDTASDDVCLIAFTSGTTGEPKGTMHFHRDMLAICDTYAKYVLRAEPTDRFTGSPPLAFTFGLGGLVLFPLRIGASTVLLEKAGPDELLAAIAKYKITIPFTAPTAYRAMLGKLIAESGAAQKIATGLMESFGRKYLLWALVLTAFIIGIPLFYGVGFVLVVPLVITLSYKYDIPAVYIGLPMLAALSVTHGYLPPHPSPTALVKQYNADMGMTLFYGFFIAVPAIIIAGPLFNALETGAFFVIDELDASMHPLLTRRLLELFQNPQANTKGAQLLFTTHDPALFDQELFRRDQIWLAEKRNGASEFFSLTDIDPAPRNTEVFLRNYLAGRYGGTPQFVTRFEDRELSASK